MCFVHDYNWTAAACDDTRGPAKAAVRCDECRQTVHPGEWVRRVYMQERADGEYCDPETGEHTWDCDGEDCEHTTCGETCEWHCCERCDKVLKVIETVEVGEGCRGDETQPAFWELRQAMMDDGIYNEGRYADAVLSSHPELAMSGHLDRLTYDDTDCRLAVWQRTRGEWWEPEYGGEG